MKTLTLPSKAAVALVLSMLLAASIVKLPPPAVAQADDYVFQEDFQSYSYRDLTTTTADWDIFAGALKAEQHKALFSQSSPSAALGSDEYLYVVWEDARNDDGDIYAQKYDLDGNRLWLTDVRVNSDSGLVRQGDPDIVAGPDGHLYVFWIDARAGKDHGDVYAQKLDGSGTRRWATDLKVNDSSGTCHWSLAAQPDGLGNLYVVWSEVTGVFGQKLDLSGNRLWSSAVSVNAEPTTEWASGVDMASDPDGTLYIVWYEVRNGIDNDVFAQKVSPAGYRQWPTDLRVNSGALANQSSPAIALDGLGYFYVVWQDERNGTRDDDIYAQKMNTVGNRQWVSDRRVNTDASGTDQSAPDLVISGDSIFAAWTDHRSGPYHLYGQMLTATGSPLWASDRGLCATGSYNMYTDLVAGAFGEFYLVWDWRLFGWDDFDVRAQKINGDGNGQWGSKGVQVAHDPGSAQQGNPSVTVGQTGDIYVVWSDNRVGPWDLYAQKYDAFGNREWVNDVRVNEFGTGDDSSSLVSRITVDSHGSLWVAWDTYRDGERGAYVQKLDPLGNRAWAGDLRVDIDASCPNIEADGEYIYLVSGYSDIYLQKLDSEGQPVWPSAKRMNVTSGDGLARSNPDLAVGPDGIYVVWDTGIANDDADVYAQKASRDGITVWSNDVRVNTLSPLGDQMYPSVATDASGVYVAWITWAVDWHYDGCYLQRLNASGQLLWANELKLSVQDWNWMSTGLRPNMATDNAGNAYIVYNTELEGWDDGIHIYMQRVSVDGTLQWGPGIKVNSDQNSRNHWNPGIFIDGDRIYTVWEDQHSTDRDLYAQRLDTSGTRQWLSDVQVVNPDAVYKPYSLAYSTVFDTASEPILAATLQADYSLNGGTLLSYLSNDGGSTWEHVTPGVAHTFSSKGSDLRWFIVLKPDATYTLTPIVRDLRIQYSTHLDANDDYEVDDACNQAKIIPVNGAPQQHTFYNAGDGDWTWFNATAGMTYVAQTANTGPNADTVLELYDACDQPPFDSDDNAFSPGALLTFKAPASGIYYARVHHHDPAVYGDGTGYELSVRTQTPSGAAVIVAGRMNASDPLQPIISATANLAYQTFLNSGFSPDNILYLNSDPSQPGVDGAPSWENVRSGIQDWARTRVALGIPLWVYLADHGNVDRFHNDLHQTVTAADLNLWLSNVEATSGVDQVNVIVDACHSGSFIDTQLWDGAGLEEISGHGRAVVASTTTRWYAYAPPIKAGQPTPAMYFSDGFWHALDTGQNLWNAFQTGRATVEAASQVCGDYGYTCQRPWLDDNGDAWFDAEDGLVAQGRGLSTVLGGEVAPYIDWVEVSPVVDGRATIRAQVRDDGEVVRVWARLFAPSFEPPESTDGSVVVIDVPEVEMAGVGENVYKVQYDGFTEKGAYQVVVYALDGDGNSALPQWVWIGRSKLFLPLVVRNR